MYDKCDVLSYEKRIEFYINTFRNSVFSTE